MERRKEIFLKALNSFYGIIYKACEAVGISRATYYNWRNEDPEFKGRVEEIMETQVDFVESKLIDLINANDTTAIIFYLKTKGKDRGYTDRIMHKEKIEPDLLSSTPSSDFAKLVKGKKAYLIKLLKENGKYSKELAPQVTIAAQLAVRVDMLAKEINSTNYKPVTIEYSREGNERIMVNPIERLYYEALRQQQKALTALGMNTDSKPIASGDDGFSDFIASINSIDDE